MGLYETCVRSEEILDLDSEGLGLDLAGCRCPVKAKGALPKVRRRGAARADYVLETVFWDAGTARLLARLLRGPHPRASVRHPPPPRPGEGVLGMGCVPGHRPGPALLRPGPRAARASTPRWLARAPVGASTSTGTPPWSPLGERGASELMPMTKSRHKKVENVRQYFEPSAEAIAEVTSLLAPDGARR